MNLKTETMNKILQVLGGLPFSQVAGLIQQIQIEAQQQQQLEPQKTKTVPSKKIKKE